MATLREDIEKTLVHDKTEYVLVYPNVYEVGMASLGFRIVHSLFSHFSNSGCERAFFRGEETRTIPRTLENKRKLDEFDVIAFSIAYENDFPNLVGALVASGIHPLREKRHYTSPLVVAGGPFVLINPEPLAPVVDIFFLGEGEVLLPVFMSTLESVRGHSRWKSALARKLETRAGFYIPPETIDEPSTPVKRVFLEDFDNYAWQSKQSVVTDSHYGDVYLLESGRGCPRRCRFCAARSIYNPVRFRSGESVEEEIGCIGQSSGGVGFLGASLSDFKSLAGVVAKAGERGYSVQTSSLRMDRLSAELLEALRNHGVRTVTTAPEAGSDRLRRAIGKDLTEDEILEGARRIGVSGFPKLKLYFMIGLPGENEEDLVEMAGLIGRISQEAKSGRKNIRITVCLSPFVPKPWTPFQWAGFERPAELKRRVRLVRKLIKGRVSIRTESVTAAAYQALLTRGDRNIGLALAWSIIEGRSVSSVLKEAGISRKTYLHRERGKDEVFPWDFIDHGIKKTDLWQEWERAKSETSG